MPRANLIAKINYAPQDEVTSMSILSKENSMKVTYFVTFIDAGNCDIATYEIDDSPSFFDAHIRATAALPEKLRDEVREVRIDRAVDD
jgi:hypothetical protein